MTIPTLAYIHLASYLVPATAGLLRFSRLKKAMRTLAVLCVFACVNIAAQYVLGVLRIKNYFISDYFRIVETSLLCAVFNFSVEGKGVQNVLRALGILFVVIWVVDMIWLNNPGHLNSGMAMFSRTLLIIMSLVTLQAGMRDERSRLVERPVFWVVMAVVLYSSGTMLVLGLSNQLLELGKPYFDVAWHINWSLLIIANLFYTKGMLCKSQV
jgi:hypothetical protein